MISSAWWTNRADGVERGRPLAVDLNEQDNVGLDAGDGLGRLLGPGVADVEVHDKHGQVGGLSVCKPLWPQSRVGENVRNLPSGGETERDHEPPDVRPPAQSQGRGEQSDRDEETHHGQLKAREVPRADDPGTAPHQGEEGRKQEHRAQTAGYPEQNTPWDALHTLSFHAATISDHPNRERCSGLHRNACISSTRHAVRILLFSAGSSPRANTSALLG